MTLLPIIWIAIGLLGTRRVFRILVSPRDPFPSFERYIGAFILVSLWWTFVGWALSFFI